METYGWTDPKLGHFVIETSDPIGREMIRLARQVMDLEAALESRPNGASEHRWVTSDSMEIIVTRESCGPEDDPDVARLLLPRYAREILRLAQDRDEWRTRALALEQRGVGQRDNVRDPGETFRLRQRVADLEAVLESRAGSTPAPTEIDRAAFEALPPEDRFLAYREAAGWAAQAREWEAEVHRISPLLNELERFVVEVERLVLTEETNDPLKTRVLFRNLEQTSARVRELEAAGRQYCLELAEKAETICRLEEYGHHWKQSAELTGQLVARLESAIQTALGFLGNAQIQFRLLDGMAMTIGNRSNHSGGVENLTLASNALSAALRGAAGQPVPEQAQAGIGLEAGEETASRGIRHLLLRAPSGQPIGCIGYPLADRLWPTLRNEMRVEAVDPAKCPYCQADKKTATSDIRAGEPLVYCASCGNPAPLERACPTCGHHAYL